MSVNVVRDIHCIVMPYEARSEVFLRFNSTLAHLQPECLGESRERGEQQSVLIEERLLYRARREAL